MAELEEPDLYAAGGEPEPDLYAQPIFEPSLYPGQTPALDDAKERALWPSIGSAIQDAIRGAALTGTQFGEISGEVLQQQWLVDYYRQQRALLMADRPDSTVGAIIQDVARFASADAPVQALMGPLGAGSAIGRYVLGPSVADMIAFDHDEARLSNTIEEVGPSIAEPLVSYLAAEPDDGAIEGKFKQALEGIITGGVMRGAENLVGSLWAGAKRLRNGIVAQREGTAIRPTVPADPRQALDLDADRIRNDVLKAWQDKGTIFNGQMKDWTPDQFAGLFELRVKALDKGGVYTADDIAAKRAMLLEQVKKNVKPAGSLGQSDYLDAVQKRRQKITDIARNAQKVTLDRVRQVLTRYGTDSAGNISRKILAEGGPEGARAVGMFSLARGGGMRGRFYATRAQDNIFGDLASGELELVSDIITMRRDAAIKVRKPDYMPSVELPAGVKPKRVGAFEIGENLETLRTRLGNEAFNKLNGRADEFFKEMRTAVDVLEVSGVIDADTALALKRFDYAPTQFIDEFLDPVYDVKVPGKGIVSVRESGIPFIGSGKAKQLIELDPQLFLNQVLTRAHSRAARNEASQALHATAEAIENSGVPSDVLRKSAPKTSEAHLWQKVGARINGKTEDFYIGKDFVGEWVTNPNTIDPLHRAISIVSGAPLVRSLATGINPLFALKNIPRDMMLAWMAADRGKLYSMAGPKFLLEMAQDLKAVLPDAWRRNGGRFQDYLDEGGGMYLLSHQGRAYKPDRLFEPRGPVGKFWEKAEHYLGYLNETQETAMRLAIRERALRKLTNDGQLPVTKEMKQQATYLARDYMDYARGGLMSKWVDTIVPYTSARIEGYSSVLKAAKTNPKEFAIRTSQLMLGAAGLWWLNHEMVGQKQTEVSALDRVSNMVVVTPQQTVDSMGNTRNDYVRIPIDQAAAPIFAFVNSVLDKMVYGKNPDDMALEAMKSISSLVPSWEQVPAVRAIAGLKGWDMWRNEAVWQGDETLPSAYQYDKSTPDLAVAAGQITGPVFDVSPKELATAVQSLGGSNYYAQAFGFLGDLASSVPGEAEFEDQSVGDVIRRLPGGRSFIGKTHPLNALERDLAQADDPAAVARKQAIDKYNDAFKGIVPDSSKPMDERDFGKVVGFLRENATNFGEFVPMLFDRAKTQYIIDEVFKRNPPDPLLVKPPAWWLELATRSPQIRADLFLEEYASLDNLRRSDKPEDQNRARSAMRSMLRIAKGLGGYDPRESDAFAIRLRRMAQERGLSLQ